MQTISNSTLIENIDRFITLQIYWLVEIQLCIPIHIGNFTYELHSKFYNYLFRRPLSPSHPASRIVQNIINVINFCDVLKMPSQGSQHCVQYLKWTKWMSQSQEVGKSRKCRVKVSKSRKQIIWSSHTPKTKEKFHIFLPSPLKVVESKKIKAPYCVK